MPKCRNCAYMIGYDAISSCFICAATSDIEYIEKEYADNEEIGCDLFVDDSNDDTA